MERVSDTKIVTVLLIVIILLFIGVMNLSEYIPREVRELLIPKAEGAIPPTKLAYEGGTQLEDQIRNVKRELTQRLQEAGCQEVKISVWREGEDIYIEARCLD